MKRLILNEKEYGIAHLIQKCAGVVFFRRKGFGKAHLVLNLWKKTQEANSIFPKLPQFLILFTFVFIYFGCPFQVLFEYLIFIPFSVYLPLICFRSTLLPTNQQSCKVLYVLRPRKLP